MDSKKILAAVLSTSLVIGSVIPAYAVNLLPSDTANAAVRNRTAVSSQLGVRTLDRSFNSQGQASDTAPVNGKQNKEMSGNAGNQFNGTVRTGDVNNRQDKQGGRRGGQMDGTQPFNGIQQGASDGTAPSGIGGRAMNGGFNNQSAELESEPLEIVTSDTANSASSLEASYNSAATFEMSSVFNQVKIEQPGTYIVTGYCGDGSITVKKGVTGVVLVLKDLDLTSTTGAALSVNKGASAKIIIDGTVKLTDAENPADEESADATTADNFDGAAIKVKDGANAYITGDGSLTIDASSCKNGIKAGDEAGTSLVIDGGLSMDITAANDGINAGYDLSILSGNITISSADDAVHADRILTIGRDGSGPELTVSKSSEALEGTVVNIFGGNISVVSSDDGINAANKNGTYSDELTYSVNITGGTVKVSAGGDGIDSNGNVNITGGNVTINSASNGGEAGIDYDGKCYIADGAVNNASGISGPDNMGGMRGGMGQRQNGQRMGNMADNAAGFGNASGFDRAGRNTADGSASTVQSALRSLQFR